MRRDVPIIAGVALGIALLLAVPMLALGLVWPNQTGRGSPTGGAMQNMMQNMMGGGMMGGRGAPNLPADVIYPSPTVAAQATSVSPEAPNQPAPTPTPPPPTNVRVDIRDFVFQPSTIEVAVGGTVAWTNLDSAPHTATAKSGAWDSSLLQNGQTWSYTFDQPGEFYYYCAVHPSMYGKVVVRGG